jgi:hypothetical protein
LRCARPVPIGLVGVPDGEVGDAGSLAVAAGLGEHDARGLVCPDDRLDLLEGDDLRAAVQSPRSSGSTDF